MVNLNMFDDYQEAFPESKMAALEPSGEVVAIDYANGTKHLMPDEETNVTFYDRIRRSQECGRNLFFEEWPVYEPEYSPDIIY